MQILRRIVLSSYPAFREVFGLFDMNGGGTIDAQELHNALDSVDIHLTKEEIEDVLCVMDEDGNNNNKSIVLKLLAPVQGMVRLTSKNF